MMDTVQQVLGYLKQYPEILAIVLGTVGSWSAAAIAEVFIPPSMAQRVQKQLTIIVNVIVGSALSAVIWLAVDPSERRSLNYAVSFVVGVSSPFTYMPVSRALAHFFPWATAWVSPPGTQGDGK